MKTLKEKYYTGKELRKMGFNGTQIKSMLEDGTLSRIRRGVYRTSSMNNSNQSFIDVCAAAPKCVIAGLSALRYYNLTTFIPQSVYIAIKRGDALPRIIYPPIEISVVSEKYFNLGIEMVKDGKYSFRIYGIEKAVCDAFRYKNKIGLDIAKEVLKEYIRRKDRNLNKLLQIAEKCKVKNIIESWLTALI
ncbi:MAG: Abortive infection protein AbiEi [Elusimicrobiota bacterium]|jgi:predicted transcriptional regulator of viral defense system|nr:Abortive infection protein AbiEi [Elusimicrobiota bacterium]